MSLFKEDTIKLPASAGKLCFRSSYFPRERVLSLSYIPTEMQLAYLKEHRLPRCVALQDMVLCTRLTTDISEIVHLRDGPMLSLVAPTLRKGGVNCVYVVRRFILALVLSHPSSTLVVILVAPPYSASLDIESLEPCLTLVSEKYLLTPEQRTDAESGSSHHDH